jgi:HK97 family phage portal protein
VGRSLIGKVLGQPKNQVPVPLGGSSSIYSQSSLSMGGSDDEAYMRAYGTMGTVFSIVSLYASATAGPEWHLYRKENEASATPRYTKRDEGSDQRTEVFKHQALSLLKNPNPFYSRFKLFEASQQHLDLTGKSYWVMDYGPVNFPVSLWPVRPDRMDPVPDKDSYLKGWVYTSPDGREKIPLRVNEVFFNSMPDPLDSYGGTGPVQSVLVDIDSAKYGAEWNRNFFLNSAEPGGVLEVDPSVSEVDFDELEARWREAHRGVSRAHRIAVLEAGVKWQQTQLSMKDMDFANLRGVSRDIVREAYRMHKVMLGVSDDVNRANAQTGEEVFSSWGVVPRLDRWKDALNHWFLPLFGSTGQDVEFDYIRPVPANREQDNAELLAKCSAWQMLVNAGADPHDALEVVGLPDMDIVEKATQAPSLPPGWVPGGSPAAPGDPGAGEQAAESAGGGDSVDASIARLLTKVRGQELAAWNYAGSH